MRLRPRTPAAIVRRYYVYEITSSVGFITPVFTLFLLYRGLSFTQVGTLSAILAVLIVVGEIPTGYVGDRIGRRNSLVLSMAFTALSLGGFVFATTFLGLAILYALWSLALTFASGSEEAWLYDTLAEHTEEEQFTRVHGRGNSVNFWTSAVTMVAGGLLYAVDPRLPFVAAAALNALAVPVLLTLPKNHQFAGSSGADSTAEFTVLDALPVIRETFARPPLRSFVLYVGLLFGVITATSVFVQPIVEGVFEAHFEAFLAERFGVGVEASMGFLYAGFAAASAVASYHAETVEALIGFRRAVVALPVVVGVALIVPVLVPLVAVPTFFAIRTSRAILNPMVNQFLNDHAPSVGRATVLSAASMIYALLRAPLTPLAGVVSDWYGPLVGVAALGVVFLVGGALVFAVEAPVDPTTGGWRAESTGD